MSTGKVPTRGSRRASRHNVFLSPFERQFLKGQLLLQSTYLALKSLADNDGHWLSNTRTLASGLGRHRRTAQRLVHQLESTGAIKCIKGHRPRIYVLALADAPRSSGLSTEGDC